MMIKQWFKKASIRAVKTAAQAFLAVSGTTAVLTTLQLKTALISALSAGLLSYITSLAGLPELDDGGGEY